MSLLVLCLGAAALLCWCGMSPSAAAVGVRHASAGPAVDAFLVGVAALLAWALVAWVTVGVLVTAATAGPGLVGRCARRVGSAVVPAAARRVLATALGLSLAAAPAAVGTVAGASTAAAGPGGTSRAPASAGLDLDWPGLRVPEPPAPEGVSGPATPSAARPAPAVRAPHTSDGARPGARAAPTAERPSSVAADRVTHAGRRAVAPLADPDGLVVVHRGDTLWDIAARRLGPQATDAAIAAEWPRWWSANRAVVGADPDLLLPGQRLTPPERSR